MRSNFARTSFVVALVAFGIGCSSSSSTTTKSTDAGKGTSFKPGGTTPGADGGGTTPGADGGGTTPGGGTAADCAPACKKLYGCEYCIQDEGGNCISEETCAAGCAEDTSAHPVAACINKAADCSGVAACVGG